MLDNFQNSHFDVSSPFFSKLANWLVIVSCIVLFSYAINTPEQNWDMLGYAGSSVSIENSNKTYIHDYIYQELELYATKEAFVNLTEKYNYRRVMFQDGDAFNQQIPFYKIRILYVLLILAVMKIGVNIFLAAHIVSATLVSAGYLVFYYAYKRFINPVFWVCYPLLIIIFDVVNVAQTVTADSLAFFWMGLISFAFLQTQLKSLFLLLIALTLVRTDMIILVALFSGYFILFRPELRIMFTAIALIALSIYFSINHFTGNYGWSTVFHYVFITEMEATHPTEYSSIGVTFKQYITTVISYLPLFLAERDALLFEILFFIQVIIYGSYKSKSHSIREICLDALKNPVLILTLMSVIYFILHFAIFPILYARFFVAQYIICALGLLSIITCILDIIDSEPERIN